MPKVLIEVFYVGDQTATKEVDLPYIPQIGSELVLDADSCFPWIKVSGVRLDINSGTTDVDCHLSLEQEIYVVWLIRRHGWIPGEDTSDEYLDQIQENFDDRARRTQEQLRRKARN